MTIPSELYRVMIRIRKFEELVGEQFRAGAIPGSVHLSIGQEGISAGVGCAMRSGDRSTSTHRGHGDLIAAGADLRRMFAELLGRGTGFCGGKGGSMHVADPAVGSLGANGLVGGGIPIALGSGLSSKLRGDRSVTVAYFGDGALNAGSFHESLNLAAIWKLPVIFVCENNLYAQFTRTSQLMAAPTVVDRARAYGIPSETVDGSDVVGVHAVATEMIEDVRREGGPRFLEGRCFRLRGHNESDSIFLGRQRYRSDDELASYMERDPLRLIVELGHVSDAEATSIRTTVEAEVEQALARALSEPFPETSDAYSAVIGAGHA
jgi:TPP-dependent pyruvate/acetoin dehydrogenase alpha subunit